MSNRMRRTHLDRTYTSRESLSPTTPIPKHIDRFYFLMKMDILFSS